MGAKGFYFFCESQFFILKVNLFDCLGGSFRNSFNVYKGVVGSFVFRWMARSLQKQIVLGIGVVVCKFLFSEFLGEGFFFWVRNVRVEFFLKEQRIVFGGRSFYGLGFSIFFRGFRNGIVFCFIKSLLLVGKLFVCCVGRGLISLRVILSQYFELILNWERIGLFFS